MDTASYTFAGTLDEVQEEFHRRQWTDGLPIIPPTVDRVERFLAQTDRAPTSSLGKVLPSNVEATVWSVAVNAVMAGCRPEYMPLLVAVVEAIADPRFRIEDAGSTPGWEPLVIVNGPVIRQIDMNFGGGVLRVGRQSNSSVGRFTRLYMNNVVGLRIPPGTTDRASIGQTFYVALAENEDVVRSIGWRSYSVDRGFEPGQSVVTVQSVVAASMPTYSAGPAMEDHARTISEVIGRGSWAYWAWSGLWFGSFHPLLVLTPSIAKAVAQGGRTKDDLRAYIHEHVKVSAEDLCRYARQVGITDFSLETLADQGRISAEYVASDDPARMLPAFPKPENIGIVVSGDSDRNQSKGYVQNHVQGPPVSKAVERGRR